MNLDLVESLAKELAIETIAGKEALVIALENIQILDKKQKDYGPKNISAFGLFGCVVRLNDKTERLKNLHNFGREQKAAMRKLRETITLLEKNWHKINTLQMIDYLDDAMTQFKILFAKKRKPALNEKMRDSFRDISNYGVIAMLIDTNKWPTEEDK